ncbi:MAG TPA: hypothetical protein VEC15_02975, partial [Actinomycetota bacterium]|nr:hypothetical protein [Actinomycetota bacterium]
MTDLEQRLRDVLHERASGGSIEPRLAPRIARRTRRRQIATAAAALLGVTAVVVGTITGLGAISSLEPDRGAASDEENGLRTVTLSIGTISYPPDWYLVEFPAGDGRGVLQLTNFEVGFSQPCFRAADPVAFPAHGALLMIDTATFGGVGGDQPADLTYDPAASACRPGASKEHDELAGDEPEHLETSWSTGSAHAMLGASATDADRATIHEAFASFTQDPDATAPPSVSGRLVLDVLDTPIGRTVLSIDRSDRSDEYLVSVSGAVSGFGLVLEDEVPIGGESTTGHVDEWGAIVAGVASTMAARAELRTTDGRQFPAFLVPLPASLGFDGQQAVWGVVPSPTED